MAYSRGCNTEDNLVLGVKLVTEGVVEVSLPSASWPMQEEDLPRSCGDCRGDLLKGSRLILGESSNVLCSKLSQVSSVVLLLLQDQAIPKHIFSVPLNLGHAGPVLKPFPD